MTFGKMGEESTGLLKSSSIKHGGTTYTNYGTVRKSEDKKPPVSGLFRYASRVDMVVMSLGIICSVIHGSSFPVLALVFGQMTNTFIIQTMDTSRLSSINVSSHIISEPLIQKSSPLIIPLTTVGDDSDLINLKPFDYDYKLNLNDTTTDSPLNDENSTFGAFFMSGMEKMTNVETAKGIDMNPTSSKILLNDGALNPEEFYTYMTKFSLLYLYIGCGVLIAAFVQIICWEISGEKQFNRLRKLFYRQILRQEIGLYDLRDSEDLSLKLSDDLERIRDGIGSKFSMVTQHLSTFFSGIIIGFYVNWRLTSVICCVGPLFVVVSGVISRISASTAVREQLKYRLAGAIAEEVLVNIKTIAAYGGELKESKRYASALDKGRKLAMTKYYTSAVLLSTAFVTLYLTYGLAFWYGSNLIADGVSSPGSIFTVFFSVMVGAFSIGNVLPFINSVSVAIGAASTIFDIVDGKPDIDPYSSRGKKIRKIKGKIEFKNVSFSYPTKPTELVLNNLSFIIEPGQTVALVDTTSEGGKSSIGSLLFRFHDPKKGHVLFDDADIKDLNVHWLRGSMGIVSQEPVLFGVSIAENIRYGRPDCTQQEIIAAAMTANAHSFIIKLPMGYDTLVGVKGLQLSGGQKQRIVIARALVKDPKVLLLDEATSVLDAQSEDVVQDALEKAQKDRTTIVITHRLSTIKNVDFIYVLQKGCVVESGTYDDFMTKHFSYSNLVKAQMKQKVDEEFMESDELNKTIMTTDNFKTAPSTTQNEKLPISIKKPTLPSHFEVDDVDVEVEENTEAQTSLEENGEESKNTKLSSVVETIIEPEKVYTDSFITEDIDGRKVNVTRKVSSHKVQRIIYLDQDNADKEPQAQEPFIYHPCRVRGSILRQLSHPDDYFQRKNSNVKCDKDFNQAPDLSMTSRNGYQYINGRQNAFNIENVGIIDLLKINSREWSWLALGFMGSILTGAIMPVFAMFYGQVFFTFTLKNDALLREAAFWSKMFIVLALASGLAWWTQVIGITYSTEKLIMRLRIRAFENVICQPVFWFDFKNSSPNIIVNRLARDAPTVKSAGGLRVGQILSTITTLIAALTIAFTFGWKLAIVLVIGVPIIAGTAYKQLKLMRKSQNRDTECMDEAGRIASEIVTNIKTVQSLAQELTFVTKYEKSLEGPYEAAKKRAVSYAVVFAVSQALVYAMYAVAFKYGAYLVEIEDMSATDVYRVFFALAFCAASVGQSSAYFQDYARAKKAAIHMFRLICRESEIDPLSKSGSKPEIKGKVHFKDVRFEYPSRPDVPVLQGVSFTVDPGKTLAIVGESGCGKSTIVSLIERFYDPSGGVIEVDDHDIRAMNLSHLRQHIGIVTKEPILFNCSIKDNIAYGVNDREVTMDEIIDVAKIANIHNFITLTLDQKYDTLIGDYGFQLSDGQKQRVAIARALIRNPKILLLDEATLALDTESETKVQKALDMACKGRTCIIIAHRLSTMQLADSVVVIHNGKFVEQGNHEELKAKEGYYNQLIKYQEITST